MKFVLSLCFAACLVASLHAAAVDTTSTTAQPKAADADATTTAAPTAASDVIEECHQPKETGRCFALFYRYAYNVESRQCEEFVYGGCNGNQNNFESKEACEQKCLQKAADAGKEDEGKEDEGKEDEGKSTAKTDKAGEEAQPVVPVVGVLPAVSA